MKLIKTANGHKIKMSKREWEIHGYKAGWLSRSELSKEAQEWDGYYPDEPDEPTCDGCGETMESDDYGRTWYCEGCENSLDEDDNFDDSEPDIGTRGRNLEFGGIDLPDSPY
jgi:hypothetical protein